MDFGDIFHVLRKHWVVLSLALALTVAGTVGAAKYGPTKYQSQVQLTMLNGPKVNAAQANYGNPYLSFTQALSIDVDLLTRNLTAVASMQQLTKLGATDQLTAGFAVNSLGPFMQLTVTGQNQAHVARSMNVLIQFAEQRWLQMQRAEKAPTDSIVALQTIAPPSPPTLVLKPKFELIGAVAIVGRSCSICIPTWSKREAADGMWRQRQWGLNGPGEKQRAARAEAGQSMKMPRSRQPMGRPGEYYDMRSQPENAQGDRHDRVRAQRVRRPE